MKRNRVTSKVMKKYSNSIGAGPGQYNREQWVAEILRLASFRYNLEEEDFLLYVNKINRRKK